MVQSLSSRAGTSDNAVVDFSKYGITFPIAMTSCAFLTIAFYNVIELHGLLFSTFKRWRGLYFWSVLTVTWGIVLNGLATLMETFKYSDSSTAALNVNLVVLLVGWYMMASGQAVVLYSRLHLMVTNTKIVRGVLIMIISTGTILLIPLTTIILMKSNVSPDNPVNKVYKVWEPLQLTVFSIQEVIISSLYIHRTVKMLRLRQGLHGNPVRKTFLTLIYINVFVICLDITLIALEYAGFDALQHFYKPCVYSLKLKLEFVILNQLVEVMKNHQSSANFGNSYSNGQKYGGPGPTTMKGSKYAAGTVNGDADFRFDTTVSGPNHIPLSDVHKNGVLKTTEVAVERDGSVYEEAERAGLGRNGSRSSSQVQFAKSDGSPNSPNNFTTI